MNAAALNVYQHIRTDGTQTATSSTPCKPAPTSTTILDYHAYEEKLDELFAKDKT